MTMTAATTTSIESPQYATLACRCGVVSVIEVGSPSHCCWRCKRWNWLRWEWAEQETTKEDGR
jgi:hypothetical protein